MRNGTDEAGKLFSRRDDAVNSLTEDANVHGA